MTDVGVIVGEALAAVYADYLSHPAFAELRGEVPLSPASLAAVAGKTSEQEAINERGGRADGRFIPGDGDTNKTPLVLVGEAPGWTEAKRGKPFVGASGRILDRCLEKVGIERTDIWVTNVVKWRPPGNRDPLTSERHAAMELLVREILAVSAPNAVVVTLGKSALQAIVGDRATLSQYQGRIVTADKRDDQLPRDLFAMRHPATALYNPGNLGKLFDDWRELDKELVKRGWRWDDEGNEVDK